MPKVQPIKQIQQKEAKVKDPPRYPKIIIPMESSMKNDYVYALNNMVKMVEYSLGHHYKEK